MCNVKANSYEDCQQKVKEKKPRQLTKKYSSAWENYKEFKDWLAPSNKGARCFYCKLCKRDYDGGIATIKQHSLTKKHCGHWDSGGKVPAEILELTEKNFNEVAASCDFVFVMFYFSFCSFAEQLLPAFEEVAKRVADEYHGRIRLGKVEVFDCKRLSMRFNVYCSPTLLFYKYKKEAVRCAAYRKADCLMEFIRNQVQTVRRK